MEKENKYYLVKITMKIEQDSGNLKKVTEQYLVDAISVTDAEAKVVKDFEGSSFDWEVTSASETKIIKILQ